MSQIDQVMDVCEGEELDVVVVDWFMKQVIFDFSGEFEIWQYLGGVFNLIYQVDYGD